MIHQVFEQAERAKLYSNPDGSEFSMVFQFEHIELDQQEGKTKWDLAPLSLVKLKKTFEKWQKALYGCGWNSLFWNNHDLPRIVSRWGNDGVYRIQSAKMLAAVLHGMQGTPYIYQGEELGMTNVRFADIGQYRDIETLNIYKERLEEGYSQEEVMKSIYAKSRDNARTPMQWDDSANAGFTEGTPWIEVNPNYTEMNAKQEREDQNSVFHFYQTLIRLRKQYPVFVDGNFTLLFPDDEKIFSYIRENEEEKLLVLANFSDETVSCILPSGWEKGEVLLCSYDRSAGEKPAADGKLRPYETYMILLKK